MSIAIIARNQGTGREEERGRIIITELKLVQNCRGANSPRTSQSPRDCPCEANCGRSILIRILPLHRYFIVLMHNMYEFRFVSFVASFLQSFHLIQLHTNCGRLFLFATALILCTHSANEHYSYGRVASADK